VTTRHKQGDDLIKTWLPPILWAACIWLFSTSFFTASQTASVIEPILRWLLPWSAPATIHFLHHIIRKSAHLSEYAVLFWLLARGPLRHSPATALVICALYAVLDETHQVFVPGRTPSPYDVGIDFSGALAGHLLRLAKEAWSGVTPLAGGP